MPQIRRACRRRQACAFLVHPASSSLFQRWRHYSTMFKCTMQSPAVFCNASSSYPGTRMRMKNSHFSQVKLREILKVSMCYPEELTYIFY